MRRSISIAALATSLLATAALADTTPEDRAAADKLFADGVALAQAGDYKQACPKLEASQALDPAIGTLMNLGACYEQLGRFASAWSSFNSCGDLAERKNDKRAPDARKRAKALEPKLSMFTLEIADEVDAAEIMVKRDDRIVDRNVWGVAVPVDPGEHVVEATMPGRTPWTTKVTVDKPGPFVVRVPKLALAASPKPTGTGAPSGSGSGSGAAAGASGDSQWGWGRAAALVAGGAGLVAIGVGTGFGVDTLGKTSAAKDHCFGGTPLRCDAEGQSLHASAKDTALVANITLIGGGVLAGGGIVLWIVAPGSKTEPAPAKVGISPAPGGLVVRGAW